MVLAFPSLTDTYCNPWLNPAVLEEFSLSGLCCSAIRNPCSTSSSIIVFVIQLI
uniref:Uncharacterized protein n=1 Tax=Anguilla anguilla TaxID=7936 RepID=A0A0E9WME0_ANGAN